MTRILLIRHAATNAMNDRLCGRTPGINLSDTGREQAAWLSQGLSNSGLRIIYSSPLERAIETAKPIAVLSNSEIRVDDRLTELDFGAWTGKRFSELEPDSNWRNYNRARTGYAPPSGEPAHSVLARMQHFLTSIKKEHDGAEVAAVTHADVIRSTLTLLLGMPLDYLLRFEITPASVTEVSLGGAYPVVHSVNRTYAATKLSASNHTNVVERRVK